MAEFLRGFTIYNETNTPVAVNVYLEQDATIRERFECYPKLFSAPKLLSNKLGKERGRLVFEVVDINTFKRISVAITDFIYAYDENALATVLVLKNINNVYVIGLSYGQSSQLAFFNEAAVVASFSVYKYNHLSPSDLSVEYWNSGNLAVTEIENLKFTDTNIPDCSLVVVKANVVWGSDKVSGNPVLCSNRKVDLLRITRYTLTGNLFGTTLEEERV